MVLPFQHVYPMQIFSMDLLIQQICIAHLPGLGPISGSNDIKMIKTNTGRAKTRRKPSKGSSEAMSSHKNLQGYGNRTICAR